MFFGAKSFNSDVSKWDVSSVNDMNGMFRNAALFTQKLCSAAWVHSKATKNAMFEGTAGSILPVVCMKANASVTTAVVGIHTTHQTIDERELIAFFDNTRVIGSTRKCSKCGTFTKSDRASCCAPGGDWYKNCGGSDMRNVEHRWFEGTEACKGAFNSDSVWT